MDKYKKVDRNGKRIKYHRWVVEQFLGRKLNSDEVVHHKDENIYNNDISNLKIMTISEHTSLHKAGKSIKGHIPSNKLTNYQREEIIKLYNLGLTYSAVGKIIGVSDNCVRKYILQNRQDTPTKYMEIQNVKKRD